ncbi:MAG: sugar phosphate isomerase/epimerase family protein [Armatimonadota bacterium]|nr:sugar phosphate isomerase/epimerase family protein [Armatimonadota bacterium]
MKLTAITDEISQDFDHALTVLQEYGVQSAELRGLWDVNIVDLSKDQVEKAKRILDDKGMSVCCIASPLFKCDLWETSAEATGPTHLAKERSIADQMALLNHCAELAHFFGTKLIRVFSFWRRGELTKEIEDRIIQELGNAAESAQRLGVILALENEHSCFLGTGEEVARVIKAVGSPALQAVWDPGNSFCAGEIPYPNGYEAIKPYIVHIHVKDAVKLNGKPKFVVMGTGEIDYSGQFKALKDDNYKGYISLETHYRPASGSAEEGSRECLEYLKRVVADFCGGS